MNRPAMVTITLAAIVVAAIAGWIAGSRVSSPAEAAARATPPEPTPIFAPVESRVLSTNVVTRGTGRFGTPIELSLAPSIFAPGEAVVTSLSPVGTLLDEGDVVVGIRGRPVVVLLGNEPMYRDLGPGIKGRDVAQLQVALSRLGFAETILTGVFEEDTAAAVEQWFAALRIDPVVATDQQVRELQPLEADFIEGNVMRGGVIVPADAIVFVPSLPMRIEDFAVGLGETIDGPFATATDATMAIDTSVPIEEAGLIGENMPVLIDEPDLGIEASGVVSRIAGAPGTDGVDGFHVYFEVLVDGEAPPALINASVRLTIPVESTGEAVLAVPITALTLGPDGSSLVQKDRQGELESIAVRPGLAAQGYVQVEAVDGTLAPGDMVLIGFEQVDAARG